MYDSINGTEYGRWISVPKHYDHPQDGTLQIYVYSKTQFNPSAPTFLFVDGGPGQNTHSEGAILNQDINQLQFDQRGLGCSTPDSWDIYADSSLYSTENTIRDMDEIRKAYGIDKVTVYGISYGTVPATMYGSKFSDHVRSVVLEGTVGTLDQIHSDEFKVEKWNLVLNELNAAQRSSFSTLIQHPRKHEDQETVISIFSQLAYADDGFTKTATILKKIIADDGTINYGAIDSLSQRIETQESQFSTPQQPMGVDTNIFTIIECKELGFRNHKTTLDYNSESGFVVIPNPDQEISAANDACDKLGVSAQEQKPYTISNYPITQPVYYFQGSHDGATNPQGALEHWKTVPKGQTYFMLAHHGGHNPNLNRIGDAEDAPPTRTFEQELFYKALTAAPLSTTDLATVNAAQRDTDSWILFVGKYTSEALNYLSGI